MKVEHAEVQITNMVQQEVIKMPITDAEKV